MVVGAVTGLLRLGSVCAILHVCTGVLEKLTFAEISYLLRFPITDWDALAFRRSPIGSKLGKVSEALAKVRGRVMLSFGSGLV